MKKMAAVIAGALFLLMAVTPSVVFAGQNSQSDTTPKQDMKQAGSSTKNAAKKTGSATKKESKKGG